MQSRIKSVGVIGGNGLLGADLVKFLGGRYSTLAITKENYGANRGRAFDAVINANGNSRRYWAIQNPAADFEASTVSVERSLSDFIFKKYIYISSSDVYPEHGDPGNAREDAAISPEKLSAYGLHKYLAELIVRNRVRDFIILRASMLLGAALKKGPIYDILHGNELFIAPASRLQFVTTQAVADIIGVLFEQEVACEIINVGGRGSFSFRDAGKFFSSKIAFSKEAQTQEYEMNVEKLGTWYSIKTSEEYLKEFIHERKKTTSI